MNIPVTRSIPNDRLLGALVGTGVALTYALVSSLINYVFVGGVPLYIDLAKVGLSILWVTLIGALLGLLVNWPYSGLAGVVLGAFSGTALVFISTFAGALGRSDALSFGLLMAFYSILPLTVILLPFTTLLRWGAGSLRRSFEEADPRLRWRAVVTLLLLGTLVGGASLYSREEKKVLTAMHENIRTVQGTAKDETSAVFQPVADIIHQADRNYALELTSDLDRFPISVEMEDPLMAPRVEIVFAYFDSGETIACLFRLRDAAPQICLPATTHARQ